MNDRATVRNLTVAVIALAALAAAGFVAVQRTTGGGTGQAEPTVPPAQAADEILAEARVVPLRHAELAFSGSGRVASVAVAEGDHVSAGQVLMTLDSAELRVAAAAARADLRAAEAQLGKLVTGATPEELEAARAAIAEARAGIASAQGGLTTAAAELSDVQAGASSEELSIAQRRVDQAKNELWAAQNTRDGVCGRVGQLGADQSECDGAKAQVGVAEEQVRIAELELASLQTGAGADALRASRGQVGQAAGQVDAARARRERAEAELARLEAQPVTEDVALADARVDQAQASYDLARLRLDQAELEAPFDGTVASIDIEPGERVAPGAVAAVVADLTAWRVLTDDLTELGVVHIQPGDRVLVRFDALPDVELPGTVERIKPLGENKLGDITYTVIVKPDRVDPRLRWNMTATVVIVTD